jgi:hypothetical protein
MGSARQRVALEDEATMRRQGPTMANNQVAAEQSTEHTDSDNQETEEK